MHISLTKAVQLLRAGEVVAFPTETVYGLGADASRISAIEKVFSTKGRPSDNPLIVHLPSKKELPYWTNDTSKVLQLLTDACWPGPLTVLVPKLPHVLDRVTAGLSSVALRVPDHPIALELLSNVGALVAPSANKSGRPSPTSPNHLIADYGEELPYLDGGTTTYGLESTVLDLTQRPFTILRPGAFSKEALEKIIDAPIRYDSSTNTISHSPRSPGMKYSHYAPEAKVVWLDKLRQDFSNSLVLTFHPIEGTFPHYVCYENNYDHCAKELYDRFREADRLGLEEVVIEPFSPKDAPIAPALLNRIEKAIGS